MSEEHGHNRRQVLKTAGAALAGLAGTSGVAAATSPKRVQMTFGTTKSPVTLREQRDLRQRAARAYRAERGGQPKLAARGRDVDDTPIVGYAVFFDAAGAPRQVSVETNDPAAVAEKHRELTDKVNTLSSQTIGTTDVTTQSSSWEFELGWYGYGEAGANAGEIDHDMELYHLTEDGDSTGENFAVRQIMTTTPLDYSNYIGKLTEDWGPAKTSPGVNSTAFVDVGPENDKSGGGTKTAEFSALNVAKSFSWTQDGSNVVTSNTTSSEDSQDLYATYDQDYGTTGNDLENEMGGASVVNTNQPSDDQYYDLVRGKARETFLLYGGTYNDQQDAIDEKVMDVNFNYL